MDGKSKMIKRTLVDRALKIAEGYEKTGNKKQADYFFKLAEKAEQVYNKKESGEKGILK